MRSIESYHRHLERTVANCGTSWIVLSRNTLLGEEFLLTPHMCKSNYCDNCRKRNLLKLRKSLFKTMYHRRWRLVTLTFPDHSADVLTTLRSLYRNFKKFIQRVRRKYPGISFIRTIEVHQSGFPHIHLVVDSFIPIAFLQKHWHDLGGGWVDITSGNKQSRVKRPANAKQAARYLTEELEKRVQDPHKLGHVFWQANLKSVTTSRNLDIAQSTGEWQFKRNAKDLADAMYEFEFLKMKATWEDNAAPGVHYGRDCIRIGSAIKSDHVAFTPAVQNPF